MARAGGDLVTFGRELLLERIEGARERVWLASPFLTLPIAHRIAEAAERSATSERRLLTALAARSVRVGVLDPRALSRLHAAGFEIASVRNLHAKVSIVDSTWGLVGSGNLTGTGLGGPKGGNVELGVALNQAQIQAASTLVAEWWTKAKPVDEAVIERYEAIPPLPKDESDAADFGATISLPQSGELAEILEEDPTAANARRYWIKSNYHRFDEPAWWHRDWISDWRRAPYDPGDLIVLYLSARDDGPATCPAVVRASSSSRHDPQWVIDHRDAAAAAQWPWVTETSVVDEVPISSGVPLSIVGKTGQSVQGGYCSITRQEFEQIAQAMLA